jgi:hypothetical protein
MDDVDLRQKMAEFIFDVAEEWACRLDPERAGLLWEAVESVARGEIDIDEFGELLDRLRSSHSIN